jgi:hypothetical protein
VAQVRQVPPALHDVQLEPQEVQAPDATRLKLINKWFKKKSEKSSAPLEAY